MAISSGLLRDPIPGDLHKHKIPSSRLVDFVFSGLIEASFNGLKKQNPTLSCGISLVGDEGFEPPTLWV